jgi:hypothetical protein
MKAGFEIGGQKTCHEILFLFFMALAVTRIERIADL